MTAAGAQDYRIERYAPTQADAVAQLQVVLWGADVARNREYLRWKYERNPYTPEPLIYVALQGDHVVGMRGYFGSRWQGGGVVADVPCACDLAVAPDHRNQGLTARILAESQRDMAQRGHGLVFNLSGGSTLTHLSQLAGGWKPVGPLDIRSRLGTIQRLRSGVRALWKRRVARGGARAATDAEHAPAPAAQAPPWDGFDGRTQSRRRPGITVTSGAGSAAALGRVAGKLADDGRIRHVRDEAWFRWRLTNPFNEYRCLVADGDAGYLILCAAPGGAGTSVIADWEAPSPDIAAGLLDAALTWGRFRRINIWAGSLGAPAVRILDQRGFRNLEPPASMTQPRRSVLVRATSPDHPLALGTRPLVGAANWDLRILYSDGG